MIKSTDRVIVRLDEHGDAWCWPHHIEGWAHQRIKRLPHKSRQWDQRWRAWRVDADRVKNLLRGLRQELGERLTVSGPHQCLFETLREAWLGQLDEETRRVVEESLRWSAPWRFVAPKLGLSASRFGTLLDLAHRELWNVQLPTPDEEES